MQHGCGNPPCSPTGISSRHQHAGLWEPDDGRLSRPVLREPGGEIPPGYSPGGVAGLDNNLLPSVISVVGALTTDPGLPAAATGSGTGQGAAGRGRGTRVGGESVALWCA